MNKIHIYFKTEYANYDYKAWNSLIFVLLEIMSARQYYPCSIYDWKFSQVTQEYLIFFVFSECCYYYYYYCYSFGREVGATFCFAHVETWKSTETDTHFYFWVIAVCRTAFVYVCGFDRTENDQDSSNHATPWHDIMTL